MKGDRPARFESGISVASPAGVLRVEDECDGVSCMQEDGASSGRMQPFVCCRPLKICY